MKKKWLSLFLALALVLGMLPAAVFADDASTLTVTMADLTLMGTRGLEDEEYDEVPAPVYLYKEPVDFTNYSAVDFSAIVEIDDVFSGFITACSNNEDAVVYTPVSADVMLYVIDSDYFSEENELAPYVPGAGYEDFDFSTCYGFCLFYDDYEEEAYVIIERAELAPIDAPFDLSAGEVTAFTEDGYSTEYSGTADLYTVKVPFGTEQLTLTFEDPQLVYAYGEGEDYIGSCEAAEDENYWLNGQTTALVREDEETYLLPSYLRVQNVYTDNGYSGGELLYAIKLEYSYTFEASVDGEACEVVSVEPGGYGAYGTYMPNISVSLYTVKVPAGTEEVDITLSDPGLLYNYKEGTDDGWLAPMYSSDVLYTGQTEFTMPVDANDDGKMDYIQVQRYYNADYSGGDLLYAITFEEDVPPTASVRIIGPNGREYVSYKTVGLEDGMTLKGLLEKALAPIGVPVYWSGGFVESFGDFPLGENDYWMSMLNDSEEAFYSGTFETIEAQDGDRLVLYAGSNGCYGWMTAHQNSEVSAIEYEGYEGTTYITGQASFHVQGYSWADGTFDVEGAEVLVTDENNNELSSLYDYGFYENGYAAEAQTDENGVVSIEFYGSCPTEDLDEFERVFEVRAVKNSGEKSITPAFCRITLTADGLTFSQPEGEMPAPPLEHKEDIEEDVQALLDALLAPDETKPETDYTADWALAMKAAGKTPTEAELTAFKKNALAAARGGSLTPAQKAKWAIALSALGIDSTQIPAEDGSPIDLVAEVYNTTEEDLLKEYGPDAYQAPFIVDLYELGMYDIPEDATLTEDYLVDLMLDGQEEDGSWYGTWGADATGMVLPGLEVIMDREGVSAAILNAFEYLSEAQSDNGSFGNIWSTIMVSMGLHAIGADDHMDEAFLKDDCAMDNILAQADAITSGESKLHWQAAWALATYQNIEGARNQNLYHFDGTVAVCTDWPDADLLTSIAVTQRPDKTVYTVGEAFDPAGLVITATYNADPENTEIVEEGYTLSEPDMTTAGNKTVTVTYKGLTATFVISVRNPGGGNESETAYITVKGLDETFVPKTKEDIVAGETTAMDLLKSVLGREGIPYVIDGNYVVSINGLAEYDAGPNSGWMYKVNGKLPGNGTVAANEYCLQRGDNLVWFYTEDYLQEDVVQETLPSDDSTAYFIDVEDSDWYAGYAEEAAELGLFAGYEAGEDEDGNTLYEFRGSEQMTRAMFVTVLRAMETKLHGAPAKAADAGFGDVASGSWYEESVNWAYAAGITAGKGDAFGVDDPVSREQMAVFLYQYAKSIGKVTAAPDLSKLDAYEDADDIAPYAKEAMAWLVGEGLMAGRGGGKLAPGATSTRAEVAAFLVNAYEYLSK